MKFMVTRTKIRALCKRNSVSRLFFFWGMLYASPIGFESMHVDTPIAHSIRECMRAYGELRALTAGVYSEDEAIAYGSRIALMCCSMARYVNALRYEKEATCSYDDLVYVAQLIVVVSKECRSWRPTDARLGYIQRFAVRMLESTNAVLKQLMARAQES